jgi:hypothetical protein
MRPAHGPFKAGALLLFGIDFTKFRLGVRFLQRMGEAKGVGKAVKAVIAGAVAGAAGVIDVQRE